MSNTVFGKTVVNVVKHGDMKLVTTELIWNYLVFRTNLSSNKLFFGKFFSNKNLKVQILMNKSVYLDLLILEISKIVMYEGRFDYVKQKNGKDSKLCHMDTDSRIVYLKEKTFTETLKNMLK